MKKLKCKSENILSDILSTFNSAETIILLTFRLKNAKTLQIWLANLPMANVSHKKTRNTLLNLQCLKISGGIMNAAREHGCADSARIRLFFFHLLKVHKDFLLPPALVVLLGIQAISLCTLTNAYKTETDSNILWPLHLR